MRTRASGGDWFVRNAVAQESVMKPTKSFVARVVGRPDSGRTFRPRRVLALTLGAIVVAAGCRSPIAAQPATTVRVSGAEVAGRAGLAPGVDILWESDADQSADFQAVKASGATWVTLDVDWNSIQGDGPSSFRWDRAMDRAVTNARAHGLSIIGVAAYSPPWARRANCPAGNSHCLPANAADFGRFIAAAAARYGTQSANAWFRGSITHWQIWNEPNHQEFAQPKPNLDDYTALLSSAYRNVKLADPQAVVITGGTAPAPDAANGTDYQPETWLAGSTRGEGAAASTPSAITRIPSR